MGAMTLALQYASNEMDQARIEIELLQGILQEVLNMERAKMLRVATDEHTELFKAFKGSLTKLTAFRSNAGKKRNAAALRAKKR